MRKAIFWLFAVLFFLVPLVLWPTTSEVFEFNKIVVTYILTTLIVSVWLIRMILVKKVVFRRTILDTPLLILIGSQLISTLLSIDPLTSWLGYYSRFNGGLLSTLCYSLLYWAFVSNLDQKDTPRLINYSLLPSATLVSLYGVLEHFGIDKNIWVQDVQSRVFSTLGQPNWLAAWLTALIPLSWSFALEKFQISKLKIPNYKFLIYLGLSTLFFWTLIFTKSRSGLLGFGVAFVTFWGYYLWSKRKEYKKATVPFLVLSSSFLVISLISGTQFTPPATQLISHPNSRFQIPDSTPQGPVLETGGTESGTIRQIVWKGAVQVWLHYPIFGSGVETFAYSYYLYRPVEHNLVSEWDFIYNKAHNEFLNYAANSGSVGLLAYLFLIGTSIRLFLKEINLKLFRVSNFDIRILPLGLLAGYASLLATNFFGFSVVPTQLEFFLFPAIAVASASSEEAKTKSEKLKMEALQKISIATLLLFTFYFLLLISRYWYADYLYTMSKVYKSAKRTDVAVKDLVQAESLEPNQALYHNELATTYATIALAENDQKDTTNTSKYASLAIEESDRAVSLSPANLNIRRSRFGVFIMLSTTNPNFLLNAQSTLTDAIKRAPTDAKLYYNLGLIYARAGRADLATSTMEKTIELKSNYKEARLAYAYLLIDKKDYAKAREQLTYILKNIDPNDSLTKQALESIK